MATTKALPLSLLDFTLPYVRACPRRKSAHLLRLIHQAVAVAPVPQPMVPPPSFDDIQAVSSRRRRRRKLGAPSIFQPTRSVDQLPQWLSSNIGSSTPRTELEKQVEKLKQVSVDLVHNAEAAAGATSESVDFSDEQLWSLYEDLLQLNPVPPANAKPELDAVELRKKQLEDDKLAMAVVEERLISAHLAASAGPSEGGLAEKLSSLRGGPLEAAKSDIEATHQHERLVGLLEVALDRMEAIHASVGITGSRGKSISKGSISRVPVSVLSKGEWMALVRFCISERDTAASEKVVDLMQRAGFDAPEESIDAVLTEYAHRGDTERFESFMTQILSAPPTENQRDLHVRAHIARSSLPATPSQSSLGASARFPTSALALLHRYEASGHHAPMKSYTRVISALFNVQTSPSSTSGLGRAAAHGQAWDLFAHMRYVAHPTPDAHLYALMIRACGSFTRPEPERALDLWTEMQENRIEPTKGAYEAIIRVCGRAGKEWLAEGLRLAREMGDRYSIDGISGRRLWCALLEGCKRAGDLNKARWILAEAVRGSGEDGGAENAAVNAEMMMHVFHTYSTYKPPFRRETTRLVDGPAPSSNGTAATAEVTQASVEMSGSSNPSPNTHDGHAQSGDVLTEVQMKTMPTFSRLPPQTPSDVIAETRALFDRITRDRQLSPEELRSSSVDGPLSGRFAHVELTSPLLNAYLSVFYRHASIESCREAFNSLLDRNRSSTEPALQADNHTYINALERCTFAHGEDLRVATRWAEDVWEHWQAIEAEGVRSGKATVGTFARLIERAHSAMRRVLLGSGDIDGALALLRTFVSRYPPSALAQSPVLSQMSSQHDPSSLEITSSTPTPPKSPTIQLFAKPPILSTRTVLTNPVPSASSLPTTARPLVRLTSSIGPRDDRVPPLIGFADVELLHTRLAERGRTKELGYLKWVCKSYESAIRKRRDAVLKAAPALSADVD